MINTKKIKDRMAELDMSKAQLIKISGLTRVTIDKILAGGEINVKTLESLANGLGVNVGFFFDDVSVEKQSFVNVTGRNVCGVNGHDIHITCPNEYDVLLEIVRENKRITEKFQSQLDMAQSHIEKLIEILENKIV